MKGKRIIVGVLSCFAVLIVGAQRVQTEWVPFNGVVCDKVGNPIRNAHIYVKDAVRYALSDKQGRFGLTDVAADDTLHVRVKKQRYDVPVEGRRSIRLWLADQQVYWAEEDQQLVDVGYGFVKRREHTGVSNGISGEELRHGGYSDIWTALQGRIPGLQITNPRFGEAEVTIRGMSSINLPTTPLFVVDGVVVNTLSTVNLYDVDYVEVLKDASIYGSRGANGAILVHTKH